MSAITATARGLAPVAEVQMASAASTSASASAKPYIRAGKGVSFRSATMGSSARALSATRAQARTRVVTMAAAEEAAPAKKEVEVELKSEMGVDYTKLQGLLADGEWEEADNETRALLITLAGEDAEDRDWVYFTEVKFIPEADLTTLDNLWTAYSDGKFGYSVQRQIWVQSNKQYGAFFKKIDWTHGENNAYRKWPEEFKWKKEAAKGHLPLTNALRGTQLIEALFKHPAFDKKGADGKDAGGSPDWMKKGTKTEFSF